MHHVWALPIALSTATFALARPDLNEPASQVLNQPSDFRDNAGFGNAIAIHGKTAVVGSPFENFGGAAYVYEFDETWVRKKQLKEGASTLPGFGASVAVFDNVLLVGNPDLILGGSFLDPFGEAYLFTRNENGDWQFVSDITSPVEDSRRGGFGCSLAIGESRFVIGECEAGLVDSWANVGAAHVFSYAKVDNALSWNLEQTIFPPDPYLGPAFASSIAMAGDSLIVGEPNRRVGEGFDMIFNVGRAYVYRWNETMYSLHDILTPDKTTRKLYFGTSVAISQDESTVAIGAEGDWLTQTNIGRAFSFNITVSPPSRTALVLDAVLSETSRFGRSVALTSKGSHVVVGAPGSLEGGAVYEFSTLTGKQVSMIASNFSALDFGYEVAFSGDGEALMIADPADVPEKVYVYSGVASTAVPTQMQSVAPSIESPGSTTEEPSLQVASSPLPTVYTRTVKPSEQPSESMVAIPTFNPTRYPVTALPSHAFTTVPSIYRTISPSKKLTATPTTAPPTANPTVHPSTGPSKSPHVQTAAPTTATPTAHPSHKPSSTPSESPLSPTSAPSKVTLLNGPSQGPSSTPSAPASNTSSPVPSMEPTAEPAESPSSRPTLFPTHSPSASPSTMPATSSRPSASFLPTGHQTAHPSSLLEEASNLPSFMPSVSTSCAKNRNLHSLFVVIVSMGSLMASLLVSI